VMEQHHMDDGVNLRVVPKIDEMLKSVQSAKQIPLLRIRYGNPVEEIVAECSDLQPELLVLGALPASRAVAAFRTGVAYQVIAQAPCPTFTLRSESAAQPGGDSRLFSTTHSIR
jgi:nucleotide-binding universal stress UspA family protein